MTVLGTRTPSTKSIAMRRTPSTNTAVSTVSVPLLKSLMSRRAVEQCRSSNRNNRIVSSRVPSGMLRRLLAIQVPFARRWCPCENDHRRRRYLACAWDDHARPRGVHVTVAGVSRGRGSGGYVRHHRSALLQPCARHLESRGCRHSRDAGRSTSRASTNGAIVGGVLIPIASPFVGQNYARFRWVGKHVL